MSCIQTSVGLGNIWRFPFTCYENGGGAFIIPYVIVLFIVGKPLYYLETFLGQFTSQSMLRIWDVNPAFRGSLHISTDPFEAMENAFISGFCEYTVPRARCRSRPIACVDHRHHVLFVAGRAHRLLLLCVVRVGAAVVAVPRRMDRKLRGLDVHGEHNLFERDGIE